MEEVLDYASRLRSRQARTVIFLFFERAHQADGRVEKYLRKFTIGVFDSSRTAITLTLLKDVGKLQLIFLD